MKSSLTIVLFAVAALSGLAFARPAQKATLEERVLALETRLADRGDNDQAVAADLQELRQLVEATVAYLEAQAKAAAAMERTLLESEDAGFTFGINPESRKILLAGWRDTLATLQKSVPGAKPEPEATKRNARSAHRAR